MEGIDDITGIHTTDKAAHDILNDENDRGVEASQGPPLHIHSDSFDCSDRSLSEIPPEREWDPADFGDI